MTAFLKNLVIIFIIYSIFIIPNGMIKRVEKYLKGIPFVKNIIAKKRLLGYKFGSGYCKKF